MFNILYIFAQIFQYLALFCTFFALFLKNACMPLLSRIGFEKGGLGKKNECLGRAYRVPAMDICLGVLCFLSKKDLKIKYGFVFDSSISNVDLGLF